MDLSKLPKLSDTSKNAPPLPHAGTQDDIDAPRAYADESRRAPVRVTAGVGAEVWISLIIGLILIMVGWNFARFAAAKLSGKHSTQT